MTIDTRITFTVVGRHAAAWRAQRTSQLSRVGVPQGKGEPRSHRPADVLAAVAAETPQRAPLFAPTSSPTFARERAAWALSVGATDVGIQRVVSALDPATGKWERIASADTAVTTLADIVQALDALGPEGFSLMPTERASERR